MYPTVFITNQKSYMEQSYIQNSLIKFLYKDADICEMIETEYQVNSNDQVNKQYVQIKDTVDFLTEINLAPAALTLQKIKMYSQVQNVQYN